MASFGEGFARAFGQMQAVGAQRDASARAFVTAERNRAQQLQIERQRAEREALKLRMQRVDGTIKSVLADIKNMDRQEAVTLVTSPLMNNIFEFSENLNTLSGQPGLNHRAILLNAANARPTKEQRLTKIRQEAIAGDLVNVEMIDPQGKRVVVPRSFAPELSQRGFKMFDAAAIKAPSSALFDERGQLKPAVTREIRQQALIGVNARRDPLGNVLDLTAEQQKDLPKIMARAEERLRLGLSDSIPDSVQDTLEEMPPKIQETPAQRARRLVTIIEKRPKEIIDQPDIGETQRQEKRIELRLEDATGILSGLKDTFLNKFLGQFFTDVTDEGVVRARQALGLLVNDWIIANKRSVGRVPVFEQMRLARIFSEVGIWKSPEDTRFALREWRDRLSSAIEEELIIMEGRQSAKEAQASTKNIQQMARVRAAINRFDLETQVPGFFNFNKNIPDPGEAPRISIEGLRSR